MKTLQTGVLVVGITLAATVLAVRGFLMAADTSVNSAGVVQADNTKMNERDRGASEPTADQAKNNKSDVEIMRQIRRAIVQDKALSIYAHNVKVIATQGKVTLKGTVHTEDEKNSIGMKASGVAGNANVTNDISVKGS